MKPTRSRASRILRWLALAAMLVRHRRDGAGRQGRLARRLPGSAPAERDDPEREQQGNHLSGEPRDKVIEGVASVRSGVVRIAELQAKGFAYLKVE